MKNVVLLTGGIAAGKTFASNFLSERGANVIDTDLISRELTDITSLRSDETLQEIRKLFGDPCFHPDGALNRSYLRNLVFSDESARLALERIMHPRIERIVDKRLIKYVDNYSLLVIPVLTKDSSYLKRVSRVLTIEVYAPEQIDRLIKRDRISATLANKIIQSQISRLERRLLADDIIINHCRHNTMRRLTDLHQQYKRGGSR